jgi:hypothetical protein
MWSPAPTNPQCTKAAAGFTTAAAACTITCDAIFCPPVTPWQCSRRTHVTAFSLTVTLTVTPTVTPTVAPTVTLYPQVTERLTERVGERVSAELCGVGGWWGAMALVVRSAHVLVQPKMS